MITPTTAIHQIDASLKKIGFEYKGPGACDYEGCISVHGKKVDIRLEVPDTLFVQKAKAYLLDRSQVPIEILAHIESEDGICYMSGAGLPLDMYEPGQAILRVLEEVKRTIELSFRGRGLLEVVDEYQMYWNSKFDVRVMLPRDLTPGIYDAKSFFATQGDDVLFVAVATEPTMAGYEPKHVASCQVWYTENAIGPTNTIRVPKTLAALKQWFSQQKLAPEMAWEKLERILYAEEMLFFASSNALVGLALEMPKPIKSALKDRRIRKEKLPEVLRADADKIAVEHYSGSWCSIRDVASRNYLGSQNMQDMSIALVGCGTIGSHLARMLVQSGAGGGKKITLIDNQMLSIGNIGRHLLGFSDVGKMKASALKAELERFHPDVKVSAIEGDALGNWGIIQQHDLLIDATGEWNVQSAINDNFLNKRGDTLKAVLHTWIFMNGAGVQSFLNLGDDFACFRCLKPDLNGPWRFPAGDEHEELNLQPASCGDGSYVPFSVDAATMAASLANRAALDWASGKAGKRLRTVIVDLDRGRSQKPVSPQPSDRCPACSSLRRSG
jgi:molybdopterin/thiamine biosynthesis adenylyltransferase